MAELKPCAKCGGEAEVHKTWIPTAFGDRPVIGYRCKDCRAKTMLYMTDIDGSDDEEMLERTRVLWNRGCISALEVE